MSKAKKIRIQKLLSELGVASRRAVEEMVTEGRVSVNGRTRTKLPVLVFAATDEIRVDGLAVDTRAPDKVYYLLNKPQGTVCTQQDPAGRRRAIDHIKDAPRGVHCVGRLDMDSTGLIVMTNDGELTQHLTHPRHGIPKTYIVEIDGRLAAKQIDQLKAPAYLDGRKTRGLKVKSLRRSYDRSLLEITLREGRNREIRRLLARLGHKVLKLKRTAIAAITDRGVKVGNFRKLTGKEVAILFKTPSSWEPDQEPEGKSATRRGPKPTRKPARRAPRRKPQSSESKRPAGRKGPGPARGRSRGPAAKNTRQSSRRRRGSK